MMMDLNKQHAAAVAASHAQSHDDDSSDGGNEEWNELDENGQEGKSSKPWVPAIDDPNYFEVLSPEEIYDSFFSIRRMGFIANRIIRKLNETKHIVSSKILEKRKKLKALQRKQFEQLSPAGIEYLKVLLKMEIAAIKNINSDGGLNPSPSIKCRLAHLALDINTSTLLSRIYEADPSMHTLELWKVLALDYVNNPMWQPRRVVNDDRLHDIDPSRAPDEKFTPESLRSVFARLRIDYTKTLLKFTQSIKLTVPVAREAIDQEFWERFAKHDKALYYLYHLFRERTLQDCLLVDPALMRQDTLDHLDLSNNNNVNNINSINNNNGNINSINNNNPNSTNPSNSSTNANNNATNNLLPAGLLGGTVMLSASNNSGANNGSGSGGNTTSNNKRDREATVHMLGADDDESAALELLESSALANNVLGMNPMLLQQQQQSGFVGGVNHKRLRLDEAGNASIGGGGGGNIIADDLLLLSPTTAMTTTTTMQHNAQQIAWQASVRKDRAIANYYKRLTINADIRFYQELVQRENVGEAIKRNAKTKVNMLLMKKIEDRYDDLVFN